MSINRDIFDPDRIYLDGMMGLIVGDALGIPVQFMSREDILEEGEVTGMEGYGTFHLPPGSWSDDSSMALATLDSIVRAKKVDLTDIMVRFARWEAVGEYTPFGQSFDEGMTCRRAIQNFVETRDPLSCGITGEYANGNGALMRILPVCIYAWERMERGLGLAQAVSMVQQAAALTHNHLRSHIACGLYFFMVKSILDTRKSIQMGDADIISENQSDSICETAAKSSLTGILQVGMDEGLAFYKKDIRNLAQLSCYSRTFQLEELRSIPVQEIRSSGYVVDSFEAALWSLITTDSLPEALLRAVNLGKDTDTIAAIAGGLAGLYYGYEAIPEDWLEEIQRREWLEDLIRSPFSQQNS